MLGLLGCCIMMVACKKTSTSVEYTPDCSGAAQSYSSNVSPVIQGSCTGCHAKYATYSGIAGDKAAIRRTIVDGSMPEGTSLTAAQKNSVVCWIDNGAVNN